MFSKSPKNETKPTPQKTASPAPKPTASQPPRKPASKGVPSILSDDLNIKGNITSNGDVQIEGQLDGDVSASIVTIGERGQINGNIKADTVHILGKVNGRIEATTIDIQSSAHVTAEMVQQNLTIASGAYVDGQCIHANAAKTTSGSTSSSKVQSLQDA